VECRLGTALDDQPSARPRRPCSPSPTKLTASAHRQSSKRSQKAALGPDQAEIGQRVCSQGRFVEVVVRRAAIWKTYATRTVQQVFEAADKRVTGVARRPVPLGTCTMAPEYSRSIDAYALNGSTPRSTRSAHDVAVAWQTYLDHDRVILCDTQAGVHEQRSRTGGTGCASSATRTVRQISRRARRPIAVSANAGKPTVGRGRRVDGVGSGQRAPPHISDLPHPVRNFNGPEFIAHAVANWCRFNDCNSLFIDPGSRWQNARVESFNGTFRDELLNLRQFDSLLEARVIIEDWRIDYNWDRPQVDHHQPTPKPHSTWNTHRVPLSKNSATG
jgi:hypothetical protein